MVDTISKKYEPQIILTIPKNLTCDFLGIMALDVLHDSKGRGYLAGHCLCKLTDLLTESIFIHNDQLDDLNVSKETIQNYVFMQVLTYFLELWSNNIKALGFATLPNATSDINELRKVAMLPLHNVADRSDDDAFTSLGASKHGIEAQNYYDQRDKLTRKDAETMAFISPAGIKRPGDYFRQASGIVDIIQERTAEQSKVVLDMKSAAGLIRTLTDPLGYTTGLPTYADPGYNMPGMSAIRQHAKIEFVNDSPDSNHHHNQKYDGVSEFRYCIKLNVDWTDLPVTFLDVTYFYGIGESGLDRKNVMINILNDPFGGSLPRSLTMAESLNQYLTVAQRPVSVSVEETLSIVERLIWNYYQGIANDNPFINSLNKIWIKLHTEKPTITDFKEITGQFPGNVAESAFNWCNVENTTLRVSYILSTLRNCEYFQIYPELQKLKGVNSICPKEMISKILPELLYSYITEIPSTRLLAFCDNQIKLLQQFIGQQGKKSVPYQEDLNYLLTMQWLPKHKGKLITQIANQTKMWRKNQALKLQDVTIPINEYISKLVNFCKENIGTVSELDHTEYDDSDPQIAEFLAQLPAFKPSIVLEKALDDHLQFYQPEMYSRTKDITKTGLLLAVTLDIILGKNSLIKINTNLSDQLVGFANSELTDHIHETLKTVIGKFSGDFGQIMWCICYGHLFASEDNNTSAMALLLHRLPKNCINRITKNVWGNIHGLGDGSCVDITIDK